MKVRLSTHLRGYTGGQAEVEAHGGTLDEVLRDLDRQYPGLRFRVVDEQDHVREHIKMFVNSTLLADDNLRAPVGAADTVHIIGALSGG
ncbi:MAG: MoaD/ThiS family protein [Chloroflexi bacterium]|nr:MoaD/ThiS family protein [Chloroflexota bacterium]